jgi:hypothetical protein
MQSKRTFLRALVVGVAILHGGGAIAAGRIIGGMDVRIDGDQVVVRGWACQQGVSQPIGVHVYAGDALMLAGKADLQSEPAVNRQCQDTAGGKHRFWIVIPAEALGKFKGKHFAVHGIRAAGAVENAALAGSGSNVIPAPLIERTAPQSYPRLAGAYTTVTDAPHLFTTKADLLDLARRINKAGSYSATRFQQLAAHVKADLAAPIAWDAAYAGCDMEIYLRAFAYEPKPAYGNDRSEAQLAAALKLPPGRAAPHGAAVAAARFALYASLVKAGAMPPVGAPGAEEATALAKRIALAWAEHGFRDERGQFRPQAELCDLNPDGSAKIPLGGFVGALTHARGVVYSAQAQDLLQGLGALSTGETARLNAFHRAMQDWILSTHNEEVRGIRGKYVDEAYNNQTESHLTALIALARLLDDPAALEAALYGGSGAIAVKMPWVTAFDVIYGPNDRPFLRISPNTSEDPRQSKPSFISRVAAAGEINDRYRNENPLQGIGYPMFTLEWLFDAAEVLRNAGFDPYGYRGAHGQSIELATAYYACLAASAGFFKEVTEQNATACPDYRQYVGKVVNAVEGRILIGSYRFPNNRSITGVEPAAKQAASSGPFALDPILFGKWRD